MARRFESATIPNTMSDQLKPCPFCGKPAASDRNRVFGIECLNCGAIGPEGEEASIKAWNTRPIEDKLRAEFDKQVSITIGQMGQITQLRKENERLRKALEYIANHIQCYSLEKAFAAAQEALR